MNNAYIFIVGKGDTLGASARAIRKAGYLVGVFQDTQVKLKDPTIYDKIIPVDFAQSESVSKLVLPDIQIAGLVCTYENYVLAKAQLGELFKLPTISMESARLCTDKALMRQAFAAYDTELSPAFSEIDSVASGVRFAEQYGFPVIVKPANLVKSLLVTRCDTQRQLGEAINQALLNMAGLYKKHHIHGRTPKLIIEQFMEGTLYSVAAFADAEGKAILCPGITALTNAHEVGFDDNFLYRRVLPAQVDSSLEARLFDAAKRGMAALKLTSSPAHVELMHTVHDEIKIIEIGARIGGYRPRMYNLTYDLDLLDMEVAIAADKPISKISDTVKNHTAVYELFPHHSGAFKEVVPITTAKALAEQAYSFNIKAKPGVTCGSAQDGYKAVAVIIVQGADYQALRNQCEEVEKLEVVLQ